MSKSHLIRYLSKAKACVSLMVYVIGLQAEFWTGKVARSRENLLQHMKLHHCSYISLLNLQHILFVCKASKLQVIHSVQITRRENGSTRYAIVGDYYGPDMISGIKTLVWVQVDSGNRQTYSQAAVQS